MVHPKKHLGQHFLTDEHYASKIIESIAPETFSVLEIGPGKGILTKFLLKKNFPALKVIEIDKESVNYLNDNLPELQSRLIQGDFLKLELDKIFPDKFSIVGNFPYNISSQILFRVLEYRNLVTELVGMFQKEVAERIASSPGNKKYGILSVLIQAYYHIEYLFTVKEGAFFPPPKVRSAVIKLTRNDVEKLHCDENLFFNLVKSAFNQRRKTLRNALKKYKFTHEVSTEILQKRAEQLSVSDFVFLAANVKH